MRLFTIGIILSGLTACGPSGTFVKQHGSVPTEAVRDSEIPTDGSIYVIRRGRFVIAPATLFCGVNAEVDVVLSKIGVRGLGIDGVMLSSVVEKMGQSMQHSDGSIRQRMLDGKHCKNNEKNVVYFGLVALNRAGKPYRLTLVVRQGATLWQGVIERSETTLHPDVFIVGNDMPEIDPEIDLEAERERGVSESIKQSIHLDAVDMSQHFTAHLTESM